MDHISLLQWINVGSNITIIVVGVKVVYSISKIQIQVETMWKYFENHIFLGSNK